LWEQHFKESARSAQYLEEWQQTEDRMFVSILGANENTSNLGGKSLQNLGDLRL
jgi:hypothetical protein